MHLSERELNNAAIEHMLLGTQYKPRLIFQISATSERCLQADKGRLMPGIPVANIVVPTRGTKYKGPEMLTALRDEEGEIFLTSPIKGTSLSKEPSRDVQRFL
jgi:hypothetical protein